MNKKIIYFSLSVWALFSACTAEQSDIAPEKNNERIIITASSRSNDTDIKPFEAGKMIAIYKDLESSTLSASDPNKIGIYKSTAELATAWENLPDQNDGALGLWVADMKPNDQKIHIFTGLIYHDGNSLGDNGKHAIIIDQTTKDAFSKSDFLVARRAYDENKSEWTNANGHLDLLFRHVLSRLDVQLRLPIGEASAGYFNQAYLNNAKISVELDQAVINYRAIYAYPKLNNGGIAELANLEDPIEDQPKRADIKMYAGAKESGTASAPATYLFQSILPKGQSYPKGSECLKVKIEGYNGKTLNYTYKPASSTIMSFEQERITTVILTLNSQVGTTPVFLNKVTITPWVDNKSNIGDLIEQE